MLICNSWRINGKDKNLNEARLSNHFGTRSRKHTTSLTNLALKDKKPRSYYSLSLPRLIGLSTDVLQHSCLVSYMLPKRTRQHGEVLKVYHVLALDYTIVFDRLVQIDFLREKSR